MNIEEALHTYFQFNAFKPGQREVISSILEGRDTVAVLPTGTGKSLCYQLPGYLLSGSVVIVTPLLSLMQDQVEQMAMRGEKKAVALNSFLSSNEKRKVLSNLHTYKFIFISPEMLSFHSILIRLQRLEISLFVIDEAHCISQWGYDFRPDYRKLGNIREQLGFPITLALTATATKKVILDITKTLELNSWKEFILSVDRPNISMKIEKMKDFFEKKDRLLEIVQNIKGPGIIYFSSKRLAMEIAEFLKKNGQTRVSAYHGGMNQENRILIQQQFIHGQLNIICATSAFGMGINKENVRYVLHFHLPLQLESYLQEIGRAGRDGKPSLAILLYSDGDEQLAFQLIEREIPRREQLDWIYQKLQENPKLLEEIESNAENICSSIGASEIQWRIIQDFLMELSENRTFSEQAFAEFQDFIRSRIETKRKNVWEMVKWVHSTSCRRMGILSYFGEEKTATVENCCDHCGIDFRLFQQHQIVEDTLPFNWQDYLKALFY
ncbi:RecQ family ATP-dependent DNA helicase [Cytobacillus sp. Hz8]|uniref:RecQ family ATP-dependent DNA helicase n=1 Tax=Cytobacillus sp. Hz8 TaxID=3347168 RepID=UPI0035DDB9B1